jgi:hypothetical protein
MRIIYHYAIQRIYPMYTTPSTQKTSKLTAFIPLNAVTLQAIADKNKQNSSKTLEECGITSTLQPTPKVANKQNWIKVVRSNVHSNYVFLKHIEDLKEKTIKIIVHERDGDYQIAFQAEKTVYFETNDSVRLLGFDPENNHSRAAAQELLKSVMTNRAISIDTSRMVASSLGRGCEDALANGLIRILPSERSGCYQLVVKIKPGMGADGRIKFVAQFVGNNNFFVPTRVGPVFIAINETVHLMGKNPDDTNSFNEAQGILTQMAEYSHYSQ